MKYCFILMLIAFLTACSSFETLTIHRPAEDAERKANDALSSFAKHKKLVRNGAWIPGYNRWANSDRNEILRSWESDDDRLLRLIEIRRDKDYVIVIESMKSNEEVIAYELKGWLKSAGISSKVFKDTHWFLELR